LEEKLRERGLSLRDSENPDLEKGEDLEWDIERHTEN
jgi:hypothetical protein